MFVDAVLANVLLFAAGQVFAWLYLRSGRFWAGVASTIALWVAIDWWLVARFVLASPVSGQRLPLLLLQVAAIATIGCYSWARLRGRRGAPERLGRFRAAMALLLAGKHSEAEAAFGQLVWTDPWDASAWVGRGDAARWLGELASARRHYRRAAGIDVDRQLADLVAHREELLASRGRHALPGPKSVDGKSRQEAEGASRQGRKPRRGKAAAKA